MYCVLKRGFTPDSLTNTEEAQFPVVQRFHQYFIAKYKITARQGFLNQAHAGQIDPVRIVCMCVCLRVCVSAPEVINDQWRDIDLI